MLDTAHEQECLSLEGERVRWLLASVVSLDLVSGGLMGGVEICSELVEIRAGEAVDFDRGFAPENLSQRRPSNWSLGRSSRRLSHAAARTGACTKRQGSRRTRRRSDRGCHLEAELEQLSRALYDGSGERRVHLLLSRPVDATFGALCEPTP